MIRSMVFLALINAAVFVACAGGDSPSSENGDLTSPARAEADVAGADHTHELGTAPHTHGSQEGLTLADIPGSDAALVRYYECIRLDGYPDFGPGGSEDGSITLKDGTVWSPKKVVIGERLKPSPALTEFFAIQERCSQESGVAAITALLFPEDESDEELIANNNRYFVELFGCMEQRGWDVGVPEQGDDGRLTFPQVQAMGAQFTTEERSAWDQDVASCQTELYGRPGVPDFRGQ